MPSFINTNLASLNAQRNLNQSQNAQQTALQRLSSGLRINSAKDDAAGMAIASRMSSQIAGSMQAARNANDGISLAQTAEGDLTQISTNLQRMRDLAVQSANATNSASDRAALNAEVQSLAQEIDRVSQNSSFNGVKLLDGSFTAQNFQVGAGATATDSISINAIASARIAQLGAAGTTTSANYTGAAITGAINAGDLTLNGQQIGASAAGPLAGQSIDSAWAVANAINASTAATGVTATANSHAVTGGPATAFTAIASGSWSINGIAVGAVAAGTTAAGQGANVAAAVNLISSQTGVVATSNATNGALTLTAADGRDILLGASPATRTVFLTQTGLSGANVGTQGTTTVASGAISGTAVSGTTTTAAVGTFTVDGLSLFTNSIAAGATGTLITAAQLDTAWTTFAAANTGYTLAGTFAAGTASITKIDGTAVTLAATTSGGAGGTITAFAAAGVGFMGTTAANTGGVDNHGSISLTSTNAVGIVAGGANVTAAGMTTGVLATAATTSTITSIANVSVATAAGALSALATIDGALASVNSSRASLGAYQNRFASVVNSLQTTTENLTASRSRIQDTDFAAETASLSRAQILQQAGTAMLAQANQLPNQVMTLLR